LDGREKKLTEKLLFYLGYVIWVIGLGSIFSFNIWSEIKLFGFNFLEEFDYLQTI
jgi:NSS family neurotransmitter:Na+ symporter